ncbi:MAG: hypothetical protein S4CHLAM7_12440 [Chlamydiae bacterium]|nr:hypothetical protein [Chlamydiota bacterium]
MPGKTANLTKHPYKCFALAQVIFGSLESISFLGTKAKIVMYGAVNILRYIETQWCYDLCPEKTFMLLGEKESAYEQTRFTVSAVNKVLPKLSYLFPSSFIFHIVAENLFYYTNLLYQLATAFPQQKARNSDFKDALLACKIERQSEIFEQIKNFSQNFINKALEKSISSGKSMLQMSVNLIEIPSVHLIEVIQNIANYVSHQLPSASAISSFVLSAISKTIYLGYRVTASSLQYLLSTISSLFSYFLNTSQAENILPFSTLKNKIPTNIELTFQLNELKKLEDKKAKGYLFWSEPKIDLKDQADKSKDYLNARSEQENEKSYEIAGSVLQQIGFSIS